jgi:hypothetical protein
MSARRESLQVLGQKPGNSSCCTNGSPVPRGGVDQWKEYSWQKKTTLAKAWGSIFYRKIKELRTRWAEKELDRRRGGSPAKLQRAELSETGKRKEWCRRFLAGAA